MANTDIGKKFEDRFKKDYQRCFPNTMIHRLPDQQSGYAGGGSSNPCDFMCYPGDCFLMVECKAHKGTSIPFTAIIFFLNARSNSSIFDVNVILFGVFILTSH